MGRSLVILAVLAALVIVLRPRGRRPTAGLRGWVWLAAGLAGQVLWVRGLSAHAASPVLLRWLPALALLPALWFLWLNRRYRGLWVLAAGAGLNLLVMLGNGGLMPIAPAVLQALGGPHSHAGVALGMSKDRVLGDGAAHLAVLDDRFLGTVAGLHVAGSLGDVIVAVGCVVTIGEELCCAARRIGDSHTLHVKFDG